MNEVNCTLRKLHSHHRPPLTPKSATAYGRNDPFDKLTSSHDFCTDETIPRIIVASMKQSYWSKQSKAASSGGVCPSDLLAAVCYHRCKLR